MQCLQGSTHLLLAHREVICNSMAEDTCYSQSMTQVTFCIEMHAHRFPMTAPAQLWPLGKNIANTPCYTAIRLTALPLGVVLYEFTISNAVSPHTQASVIAVG